jgi:hypothetical protein
VQVEIPVVAPIPRFAVLAVFTDTAKIAYNKGSDASFHALLYDCFRECV